MAIHLDGRPEDRAVRGIVLMNAVVAIGLSLFAGLKAAAVSGRGLAGLPW